jgi:hypothetical protein
MPPDLMFWIGVAIKMAITALFVSVATIVAEKLGSSVHTPGRPRAGGAQMALALVLASSDAKEKAPKN